MTESPILDVAVEGDVTLRTYLADLLTTLWREGSDFSAKRPLGSSDWQFPVYAALIRSGHVHGSLDDDGYPEDVDTRQADVLVDAAIRSLFE